MMPFIDTEITGTMIYTVAIVKSGYEDNVREIARGLANSTSRYRPTIPQLNVTRFNNTIHFLSHGTFLVTVNCIALSTQDDLYFIIFASTETSSMLLSLSLRLYSLRNIDKLSYFSCSSPLCGISLWFS